MTLLNNKRNTTFICIKKYIYRERERAVCLSVLTLSVCPSFLTLSRLSVQQKEPTGRLVIGDHKSTSHFRSGETLKTHLYSRGAGLLTGFYM